MSRITDLRISVHVVFSTVLQRMMYNRLISFVSKFDLLPEEHFRFRDGKSTEWASQTFTEYIQEGLHNQSHIMQIFFDLTTAMMC
jgi:hypothetical protein